jgi:hypothetical protein
MNDPRMAAFGGGIVKGPKWGAEALRRYKLIGGTPETLDTALKRRAHDPELRRSIVRDYRKATDLAAPNNAREMGYRNEPTGILQHKAMENAGLLYDHPAGGRPWTYTPFREKNLQGPKSNLSEAADTIANNEKYGRVLESQTQGNAAYGAVSRSMGRIMDEPGFMQKRMVPDLPNLTDSEYYNKFPLAPPEGKGFDFRTFRDLRSEAAAEAELERIRREGRREYIGTERPQPRSRPE